MIGDGGQREWEEALMTGDGDSVVGCAEIILLDKGGGVTACVCGMAQRRRGKGGSF